MLISASVRSFYAICHKCCLWLAAFVFPFLYGLLMTKAAAGQVSASFTFTPNNECSPMEVSFSNTSSGSGLTYFWDFGDGNTSDQEHPTHTFVANPGNGTQPFTVQLTVTSGDESDNHTEIVTVLQPPGTQLYDTGWPEFAKCTGEDTFVLTLQNWSFTDNLCL